MAGYRNDREYVKRRDALRRQAQAYGLPCSICLGAEGPILFDVDRNHPLTFEADHVTPVSVAMAMGMSQARAQRGELRPAHRVCNQRRGNKADPDPGRLESDVEVEW